MESRIAMSQRERDVLKVMGAVLRGERTQAEAARSLRKSARQVRRLQRRLEAEGDAGVAHRLKGRASNRQLRYELRAKALELYKEEVADFGPTPASEVMAERGLKVSGDTLRRWLTTEGPCSGNGNDASIWTSSPKHDRRGLRLRC